MKVAPGAAREMASLKPWKAPIAPLRRPGSEPRADSGSASADSGTCGAGGLAAGGTVGSVHVDLPVVALYQ